MKADKEKTSKKWPEYYVPKTTAVPIIFPKSRTAVIRKLRLLKDR